MVGVELPAFGGSACCDTAVAVTMTPNKIAAASALWAFICWTSLRYLYCAILCGQLSVFAAHHQTDHVIARLHVEVALQNQTRTQPSFESLVLQVQLQDLL